VKVKANVSKRRGNDVVPLHSAVVIQLRDWLALKGKIGRDELLFNLRSQGGSLRRTSKMMEVDLKNARVAWIDNAATIEERIRYPRVVPIPSQNPLTK